MVSAAAFYSAAVLAESVPERGTGTGRHGVCAYAGHAWTDTGVSPQFARFEEEVDSLLRPSISPGSSVKRSRPAARNSKSIQEGV